MAIKNAAITVQFVVWDTANNVGKTGDTANITLRGVGDGTEFTPSSPSITEVDSTNLPGVYKASLTAGENNYTFVTLGGKSATTDCVVIPISWGNEQTGDTYARIGANGAGLSAIPWNASWDAEVQSECADALNAYDPPTNAEMVARTIAAADYATAASLLTIAGYLDTEIAAILADTNELQTDLVNGGRLDLLIDAIKAKTDTIPTDPADQSAVEAAIAAATAPLATTAALAIVDANVDAILEDTGTTLPGTLSTILNSITAAPAAVWNYLMSAMTTVGSIGRRLAQWLTETPIAATAYGATDLSICNNALVQLGNEPLLNLTDTTKKAVRLCVQFYDQTVEEVLRAYNWNCATVRDTLTVDETPPEWGYNYRYALPADCLRVIGFSSESVNWKIENGYILADTDSGEISYIKLITAADMDALLRSAVSARLAAYLAFPLTNSATVAKAMFDLYKEKLADAHTMDAFENGTGEHLASDTWINARGQ
jgi:hypothetical protein